MFLNSNPLTLLVIVSYLVAFLLHDVSAVAGGRSGGLVGGWRAIEDPKDPKVQEIGQFAVNEHNKQAKKALKFLKVIRGESQVVAGTNYRLVIAAKERTVSNNYEALVWDKPWVHFRNLTSFKRL